MRSIKFAWSQKLGIGGTYAAGAMNDVVKAPGHTLGYFYDPTNGSVSRGDIVRSPVVKN